MIRRTPFGIVRVAGHEVHHLLAHQPPGIPLRPILPNRPVNDCAVTCIRQPNRTHSTISLTRPISSALRSGCVMTGVMSFRDHVLEDIRDLLRDLRYRQTPPSGIAGR